MSTQTEITRLQTARNKLRTWLVGLGLAASTDKLDALADKAAAIKNNGAVDANVKEGESYTIPAGYHNGSGTVKGVSGGGNYNLQAKSVTPTKEQQSITADQGYYGLSGVAVGAGVGTGVAVGVGVGRGVGVGVGVGVGLTITSSPNMRLIVSSPTLPSTFARLCARWKAITAARVPSPNTPSTLPR